HSIIKSKWCGSRMFRASSKTAMSTGNPEKDCFFSRLVASEGDLGTRHSVFPKTIWSRLQPNFTRWATSGPTTFCCSGVFFKCAEISADDLRDDVLGGRGRIGDMRPSLLVVIIVQTRRTEARRCGKV